MTKLGSTGDLETTKPMYEKANAKVESMTTKMETILCKIAVSLFILPKAIDSYYQYFMRDGSEQSFQLPYDRS